MKLVLSGPIDDSLRNEIARIVHAKQVTELHVGAIRLAEVNSSNESRAAVALVCATAKVDHAFMEASAHFSKIELLAIDMDSTLITIECIDEMADYTGKKREVAAITEAAMRGDIKDFSESLCLRAAILEGMSTEVMRLVFDERLHLSPGALNLLGAAKANSVHTLLVSGGFTYFTDRLQRQLGLNAAFANTLESHEDRLTGKVLDPILDAEGKAARVAEAMKELNCTRDDVIVIGDGANDIPMMRIVRHSIAYHAKQVVRSVAAYRIDYGNLNTAVDFFT